MFGFGIRFIIFLVLLALLLLGGLKFMVVSIIFFGLGGLFEFIIMNNVQGPKVKLMGKIPLGLKMQNGFLWVHAIVRFIKINGTTIYDYNKLGLFVMFTAYLIMVLYVGVALLLFKMWGSYAFYIYLIPIGTNIITLLRR